MCIRDSVGDAAVGPARRARREIGRDEAAARRGPALRERGDGLLVLRLVGGGEQCPHPVRHRDGALRRNLPGRGPEAQLMAVLPLAGVDLEELDHGQGGEGQPVPHGPRVGERRLLPAAGVPSGRQHLSLIHLPGQVGTGGLRRRRVGVPGGQRLLDPVHSGRDPRLRLAHRLRPRRRHGPHHTPTAWQDQPPPGSGQDEGVLVRQPPVRHPLGLRRTVTDELPAPHSFSPMPWPATGWTIR